MVDSCRQCVHCQKNMEQYCLGGGMVGTYNARKYDRHDQIFTHCLNVSMPLKYSLWLGYKYPHCLEYNDGQEGGGVTYGGYSQRIVTDEVKS